nr:PREDICTED: AT-hook motif nuclear-localized protein 11-like [Musa acuminata subsp. malaccensis]
MDPRRVPSYAYFPFRRVSYSFRRVQATEQHDIRDGSSGVFSPAENVPSYRIPAFQPTEQHGIRDGSSGVFMASYPTPASQPTEQHDIRYGSSGVFSPAENVPSNPTPVSLASTPSVDPGASASQVTLHPGSVRRKRGRPRIHPRRVVDQRTTSSPLPGPSSSLSPDAPLPDQPVRRKRGRPRGRSRKALGNAGRNFMTHVLIIESGE